MKFKPYIRKVNYYETDRMSIVHHSNYIRYFEEARIYAMEQINPLLTNLLDELAKIKKNSIKKEFEGTAKINEDLFFRDHSIHKFLIVEKHKTRLLASNVPKGVYFSNEFRIA